jgi:very-short-patch-repair endonuclease
MQRVHTGVFASGHAPLTRDGRWMAAVLACWSGAVLSHRSAASRWGLRASERAAIDVTTPSRTGRTRDGIDVHDGATLRASDVADVDGIPCTSVARTLLDLADAVNARALERAVERAEMLRLLDMRAIDDVLGRAGGAEADFLWRERRLIVEVDGRDVHTTRRAFERDRRRDQRLVLAGWRVLRFTWRQVLFEPAYVAATLRGLLEL